MLGRGLLVKVLLAAFGIGAALGMPLTASAQQVPTPPTPTIAPSINWSGYVATNGYYTGVSALMQAPTPFTLQRLGVTASWVGIGGAESDDLIQAGLEVVQEGPYFAYDAWYETLPQASRRVALTIGPGDWVLVNIHELAHDYWQLTIVDGKQVFQTQIRYASTHSSAEWILEEPALVSGELLPLGPVKGANFAKMSEIINGQPAIPAQVFPAAAIIVGPYGRIKAVPTLLGADGASFTVTTTP